MSSDLESDARTCFFSPGAGFEFIGGSIVLAAWGLSFYVRLASLAHLSAGAIPFFTNSASPSLFLNYGLATGEPFSTSLTFGISLTYLIFIVAK